MRAPWPASRIGAILASAGCALALAGCAGPPLPADPHALEAELRARVEMVRAALASFHAEGTVAIDGPDRVTLNWRADAVRGRWARVAVSSSLATDPIVEVRALAGDELLVRVTSPGGPPALYRAPNNPANLPVDEPMRATAGWLSRVARGDRPATPQLSIIGSSDDVVRVELARERPPSRGGALAAALRRSDGMPLEIEALLPGTLARVCVVARPRGDRALAIGGTPLSLPSAADVTVQACCNRKPLATVRLTIAQLRNDAAGPLSHWAETAQPIAALRDDRRMRRTLRDVQAVLDAAARTCQPPDGGQGR